MKAEAAVAFHCCYSKRCIRTGAHQHFPVLPCQQYLLHFCWTAFASPLYNLTSNKGHDHSLICHQQHTVTLCELSVTECSVPTPFTTTRSQPSRSPLLLPSTKPGLPIPTLACGTLCTLAACTALAGTAPTPTSLLLLLLGHLLPQPPRQ